MIKNELLKGHLVKNELVNKKIFSYQLANNGLNLSLYGDIIL